MPEGTCNKCGERRELVLAGCVCRACSDALDKQWASATSTDWVLIAAPFASEYQGLYPASVRTAISVSRMLKERAEFSNSPAESISDTRVAKKEFPPLHWVGLTSPEAE